MKIETLIWCNIIEMDPIIDEANITAYVNIPNSVPPLWYSTQAIDNTCFLSKQLTATRRETTHNNTHTHTHTPLTFHARTNTERAPFKTFLQSVNVLSGCWHSGDKIQDSWLSCVLSLQQYVLKVQNPRIKNNIRNCILRIQSLFIAYTFFVYSEKNEKRHKCLHKILSMLIET